MKILQMVSVSIFILAACSSVSKVDFLVRPIEKSPMKNAIKNSVNSPYNRPVRSYFDAETANPSDTAYVKGMLEKLKRIGKQIYLRGVKGTATIEVGVYRNGRIESIKMLNVNPNSRTNHSVLAEVSQEIVRRAAPFGLFSADMSMADILHVTQEFIFKDLPANNK